MKDVKQLDEKKGRLKGLLDSKSRANCDTRHLSPADIRREQEIENLEGEIADLEKELRP